LNILLTELSAISGDLATFEKERLPVPKVKMQMISPPPSPPEGWVPIPETGPNKISYIDLTPTQIDEKRTLLLPQSGSAPSICLHDTS